MTRGLKLENITPKLKWSIENVTEEIHMRAASQEIPVFFRLRNISLTDYVLKSPYNPSRDTFPLLAPRGTGLLVIKEDKGWLQFH